MTKKSTAAQTRQDTTIAAGVANTRDANVSRSRTPRVSRREFVQRIARRTNHAVGDVQDVYDAMLEEIVELTTKGYNVTFTGFGRFYTQPHKGHRVRFADPDGDTQVPDYMTLKFSATSAINKQIKDAVGDEKVQELLAGH